MRNLTTLLCAILCFTACKKSSNKLPITPATLSGTWVRQSATANTYTNGVLTNSVTTTYYSTTNARNEPNLSIYFAANLSGTYFEPGLAGLPFTYVIAGDQLNLNYGIIADLVSNYIVKSVTNTQLELVDGTPGGNTTVFDVTYLKNQ
jgi:hypothetical protein